MLHRAYSLLNVKGIDEEKREITGMATTPTPDRYGDIVEPKGADFDLPIPLLWQHDGNQPIGHVLAARVTKDGIEVRAKFAKIDEPGRLKDRLDEAWQSVKTGLVRGLSIGFRSIEHTFIEGTDSLRFLKWAWLELSAVTIPANAEASIQTIKTIDSKARAAFGPKRSGAVRLIPSPGVPGTKRAKGAVHLLKEPK
jgi:HK97 family phage prohead protease